MISVPFQNNVDWGGGPTAIALRQQGKFTYGALLNQP